MSTFGAWLPTDLAGDAETVFEITAVLHRYATAIDTKDWLLLATCFEPRCVFTGRAGALRLDGADALVAYMRDAHTSIDGSLHRLSNITIDVGADGRTASATSYLDALVVHRGHRDGPTFQLVGTYRDRLVLGAAGWWITRRDVAALWSAGNPTILGPTLT